MNPKTPPFASLLGLSVCLGCAATNESPPGAQPLAGVWQTEGYGHVVEIHDDLARFYEVTASSCLPSWEMTVLPPDGGDAEAILVLDEAGLQIDLQPGAHADERWMRIEQLASRRRLTRVSSLPDVCARETPSDPISVFDVFWQTYVEHYPFFALKGIDWPAVRERERPGIHVEMSDEALFEVLQRMIEPLEDAHTFLAANDIDARYGGRRPDPNPVDDQARQRVVEVLVENYLIDPLIMTCNDQIGVGRIEGGVRYLVLGSFNNYGDDFRAGMNCLDAALDRLLVDPAEIRGVVLDVRINSGGADPYGLAIASRFATSEYLAYTKETRNDPEDDSSWSEGQPSVVRPTDKTGFPGPTVLLTGRRSVSAAETFTMALMGRTPHITRIGNHTQGVFSDVLGRTLPNGWSFGLPNERFLTADGRSFDGPGVPPDIERPVFTPSDLDRGVDSALEAALELLRSADTRAGN